MLPVALSRVNMLFILLIDGQGKRKMEQATLYSRELRHLNSYRYLYIVLMLKIMLQGHFQTDQSMLRTTPTIPTRHIPQERWILE